jgi:hypothetical protein
LIEALAAYPLIARQAGHFVATLRTQAASGGPAGLKLLAHRVWSECFVGYWKTLSFWKGDPHPATEIKVDCITSKFGLISAFLFILRRLFQGWMSNDWSTVGASGR